MSIEDRRAYCQSVFETHADEERPRAPGKDVARRFGAIKPGVFYFGYAFNGKT